MVVIFNLFLQHFVRFLGGLKLLGKGFVYQEDNDPKHSSIICRDYLDRKEKAVCRLFFLFTPLPFNSYFFVTMLPLNFF